MKNANIFIDVDLTLVDLNGRLLEGALESITQLAERGCHLFLWSTGGIEYCQKIARLHKLDAYIQGYVPKPDIVIDDLPPATLAPIHYDVNRDGGWREAVQDILKKHVD
jgi:hypothetical protein